jgi:hypothetical protein
VYFNVPKYYAAAPIYFYLDGSYAGEVTGYGGPTFQDSEGLQYNTLAYSATNLQNGTHSVIVVNNDYTYSPPDDDLFYFDYAVYTVDWDAESPQLPVAAIIGASVGGAALLVIAQGIFLYCFCWRRRRTQKKEVDADDAGNENDIPTQRASKSFPPLKYGGQAEPMPDHTYQGLDNSLNPPTKGPTPPAPTYASTSPMRDTSRFEADTLYRPSTTTAGPSISVPRSTASPSSAHSVPSTRLTGTPPIGDAPAFTPSSQGRTFEELESDVHRILAQMKDMKHP